MESFEKNPGFLTGRYTKLSNSPEVAKAVRRTERKTGQTIPRNPERRVQSYLDQFTKILATKDLAEKEFAIDWLKKFIIDKYVVRREDVLDSRWESQRRVLRRRGEMGDLESLPEDEQVREKESHLSQTKEDQKGSLEEWIDYFASDKSSYLPDYLKYWVFAGMLKLERYERGDKEHNIAGRFPARPSGEQRSVKMFPEVNERGLRFIAEAYKALAENKPIHFRYDIPQPAQSELLALLSQKDFQKIYGWAEEYLPAISQEEMEETRGLWTTYAKGSVPQTLANALRGKGSGWCIAGENIAGSYLKECNLHVYFTKDRSGNEVIPRVVIVEKPGKVTEVRGIAWEENVDEFLKKTNIISDKLGQIPGGDQFYETDKDTKLLTAIEEKTDRHIPLSTNELAFLYEIERPIKYFGYQKDPRIKELRDKRNSKEDAPVIFDCRSEQIAWHQQEVTDGTKVYLGSVYPNLFRSSFDQIHPGFPESALTHFKNTLAGGKSGVESEEGLKEDKTNVSPWAHDILDKMEHLATPEYMDLVRISVKDMGFPNGATTAEILGTKENNFKDGMAYKLGLELCPPDVGPALRKAYTGTELFWIGMEPIFDRYAYPLVFYLRSDDDDLWLYAYRANPGRWWNPDDQFVFRLRKLKT